MPLYEYQCDVCEHRFEVIQKFSDPLVEVCPKCSGKVTKLFSSPAIQFKGSGWYITDYAKKSGSSSGGSKQDSASGSSGPGDSGGDSKSSGDSSSSESKSGDSKSQSESKSSSESSTPKTPTPKAS